MQKIKKRMREIEPAASVLVLAIWNTGSESRGMQGIILAVKVATPEA
jgi:hypothetical protein